MPEAQRPVDGIEVESLRIECAADPRERAVVLLVLGVFDRGEELLVARRPADIIRWSGTCAGGAERVVPISIGRARGFTKIRQCQLSPKSYS